MNSYFSAHANTGVMAPWLWFCVFVAIAVFATILYSIATFRSSNVRARHSLREFIWAVVPIAIVIAAALPALNLGSTVVPIGTSVLAQQDAQSKHCGSATNMSAIDSVRRLAATCTTR